MTNTNLKGTIGEAKVTLELLEHGWEVFKPISDFCPIDLIAYKNYTTLRIQVKYRNIGAGKVSIEVPFCSVVNGVKVPADLNNIDFTAVYSPDLPSIVYIPTKLIKGRRTISINPSSFLNKEEFWKVTQIGSGVAC